MNEQVVATSKFYWKIEKQFDKFVARVKKFKERSKKYNNRRSLDRLEKINETIYWW